MSSSHNKAGPAAACHLGALQGACPSRQPSGPTASEHVLSVRYIRSSCLVGNQPFGPIVSSSLLYERGTDTAKQRERGFTPQAAENHLGCFFCLHKSSGTDTGYPGGGRAGDGGGLGDSCTGPPNGRGTPCNVLTTCNSGESPPNCQPPKFLLPAQLEQPR